MSLRGILFVPMAPFTPVFLKILAINFVPFSLYINVSFLFLFHSLLSFGADLTIHFRFLYEHEYGFCVSGGKRTRCIAKYYVL
jgi:hypothetical protein